MASTTNVLLISLFVLYLAATITISEGASQGPAVSEGKPEIKPWLRPWIKLGENVGAGVAPAPAPTKQKYGKRSIARTKLKVRGKYCMPKTGTSDEALQKNINYLCKRGIDCVPIQPGGACFKVDASLYYRAAFVMHLYYNINERRNEACDFFGTGNITTINPTVDKEGCIFK